MITQRPFPQLQHRQILVLVITCLHYVSTNLAVNSVEYKIKSRSSNSDIDLEALCLNVSIKSSINIESVNGHLLVTVSNRYGILPPGTAEAC